MTPGTKSAAAAAAAVHSTTSSGRTLLESRSNNVLFRFSWAQGTRRAPLVDLAGCWLCCYAQPGFAAAASVRRVPRLLLVRIVRRAAGGLRFGWRT